MSAVELDRTRGRPSWPRAGTPRRLRPSGAICRRAFADSRVRNASFAALFALVSYAQVSGYRSSYPTLAERLDFARSFGANSSVRLFYGRPYDLLTVGGYSAWRVGGILSIFAAMWGVLAAVRALRAEEEAGRFELILCGAVGRRGAYLASLAAVALGAALLWAAVALGLVAGGLALGESAYLALAIASAAVVFAGVGALVSQLAPTRRLALELGSAAVTLALLTRVVADTDSNLEWLRWLTPLGWVEEMRAFTGSRPPALIAPAAAAVALMTLAGAIAVRRDVGDGLLSARDSSAPRLRLLSSPTALALRCERASLAGWLAGSGFFALIVGAISTSVSSAGISENLKREFRRLGVASIDKPSGYIGFSFLFFVLVVSLHCCAQLGAARHEEAEQRLETLFAMSVSRGRWLGGRLALACASAAAVSLAAGVAAWLGAETQGAGVSLASMLEAGANCLPTALLFGGVGALAFALAPRAGIGIAYGLVAVAFLWQLVGQVLGAPHWLLDATPFQHVGLVPAQPFKAQAAAVMLAVGAACAALAVRVFSRRDLAGA